MPPRQILYSVVGGPSQCMLKACISTGQKMHFVCRDEHGGLDEFDMTIVGKIKPEVGSLGLVFNVRDMSGLVWSMIFDPTTGTGNMMHNFARR